MIMIAAKSPSAFRFRFVLTAILIACSTPAHTSAPLPENTITTIKDTLQNCSGGWYETNVKPSRFIGPEDLQANLSALDGPSTDLDKKSGNDLYRIARAMLPEFEELPDFILDRSSSLKCTAQPQEAIALMKYLSGEGPKELRGVINTLNWLGLAAEQGVGMPPDVELARRYYLRARMHSSIMPNNRWSDGIDDDLLANIERAGFRAYLEQLALVNEPDENGGAARMILAEEIIDRDPLEARNLLRTHYVHALNRLLELEATGRIPTVHDQEDVAFWAGAAGDLFGYKKWFARAVKGAELSNGGFIPTMPERPNIKKLRKFVNLDGLKEGASQSSWPIPVRALVDPSGKALFVEDCRADQLESGARVGNLSFRLQAIRLYRPDELPQLPVATIDDRPSYGWVILPAVLFSARENDEVEVKFLNLPAEDCAFSNLLDADAVLPGFGPLAGSAR